MKYIFTIIILLFLISCKKETSQIANCGIIIDKQIKGISGPAGAKNIFLVIQFDRFNETIQVGLLQYQNVNIGDQYCR